MNTLRLTSRTVAVAAAVSLLVPASALAGTGTLPLPAWMQRMFDQAPPQMQQMMENPPPGMEQMMQSTGMQQMMDSAAMEQQMTGSAGGNR